MIPYRMAGKLLQLVMLLLLTGELTGCCLFTPKPPVLLEGSRTAKLQKSESAPFAGWLLQDEVMTRLLEKAEQCKVKP